MRFQNRLLVRFAPWIIACFALFLASDIYLGTKRIQRSIEENLYNITDAIRATIKSATEIYQEHVADNIRVAEYFLGKSVRLSSTNTHSFFAQNQISKEIHPVSLPVLEVVDNNGSWVALPEDFSTEVTELIGGTVSVFQVFDQGLLRISTSVQRADGTLATGTFIPQDSAVYRSIIEGRPFKGRAFVVNDWYITIYKPIFNASYEVIGAIYVGVSQQNLNVLRSAVTKFRSEDSYYSTVLDINGNIIIHPRWQGMNIEDVDAAGVVEAFLTIKESIEGKGLTEGRVEYELDGRRRINYFAYLPENEWIVLSGVDSSVMSDLLYDFLITKLLIIMVVIGGLIFVIWSLSRSVARPIHQLRNTIATISRRNFNVALPDMPDDDTRKLAIAFQKMAARLNESYQHLESRVESRTRELQEKSAQLQEEHDKAIAAMRAKELEIQQREIAEDKLKESEAQYRTLVSSLPGLIFRCEPCKPFKIHFASNCIKCESGILELGVGEGSEIALIAIEEDRPLISDTFEKSLETEEPFHVEFRFKCIKKHMTGWFSLRGSPELKDGKVTSIDCVVFNITQQKSADAELHQMRVTEAEQRGKLEMSSSVLHDIGNAVTNLATTVGTLLADSQWPENIQLHRFREFIQSEKPSFQNSMGPEKTEALLSFVKELQQSFQDRSDSMNESFRRLASIVRHVTDILHLQRRYTNSATSDARENLRIRDIISDTLSIFSGSLERRSITVDMDIKEEELAITGDRTRLLQVFNNLIKNACEAIDMRLENDPDAARNIKINISESDNQDLQVEIIDSGIGFESEAVTRLSQRGFTTKPGGSGIGLDQCHKIMEAHGGSFQIESDGLNRGAKSTIRMPLRKSEDQKRS